MSYTMHEKLDRLSLLSGMGWLEGMYSSEENDETKSKLVDVLYEKHEKEIEEKISTGKMLIAARAIDQKLKDIYTNGANNPCFSREAGCFNPCYHNLERKLPAFIKIDSRGNEVVASGDKFIRMNIEGLRYFVNLQEKVRETMKNEMKQVIHDSEIVPNKYQKAGEEMSDEEMFDDGSEDQF